MEKNVEISYEKIEDILYLGKNEKVKFSVDLSLPSGDAVVDMGFDGLVKGIEIFNASKFFSLVQNELEKIKNAELKIVYSPSYVVISISLESKKGIAKSNVVVPYNKKLILAE